MILKFIILDNKKRGPPPFTVIVPSSGTVRFYPRRSVKLLDKPIPGIIVLINGRSDTSCTLVSIA